MLDETAESPGEGWAGIFGRYRCDGVGGTAGGPSVGVAISGREGVSGATGPDGVEIVAAAFDKAARTALRTISGVIGLRTKSVAPSFIASTASSIEANAVIMMMGT